MSSLTLDQAVFDAVALSEYLCSRFDEERIYLVGESWGTILGIMAAERRPDLYHAYVGSGQMVDVRETDRGTHRALLEHAERTGDDELARRLQEVDLRRDVPRLDVPVYMVAGAHELESRAALVPEYSELPEAPRGDLPGAVTPPGPVPPPGPPDRAPASRARSALRRPRP